MIQTTTGYVELSDGKLYYEMAGQGRTLVLSHAGFLDSGMWDDQWRDLTQRYQVIRYDMRGFGRSSPATGPVSRRDDLLRVLRSLNVERAALIGCSIGAEASLDLALEHPELVSSLVLVSIIPGGFEMQGAPPRYLLDMMGAVQQGDMARASDLQIRIWVDGSFREPGQVDPAVRQRAAEMNRIALANGTWGIADNQPLNPLDPPAAKRLAEIHVPTLIVVGALDHPEFVRAADVLVAGIRGAKKLILPDSAHVPSMERPEEFNRAVEEFLTEVAS